MDWRPTRRVVRRDVSWCWFLWRWRGLLPNKWRLDTIIPPNHSVSTGMAVEETEYCCSFNHRGWNSSIVIRFIWRGKPNVGTVETTAESPADQRRQWSYGEDSTCRLQQTYETSAQDTEDTLASLTEQLNQPDIELMLVNTLFQKGRCIYHGSCRTTVGWRHETFQYSQNIA